MKYDLEASDSGKLLLVIYFSEKTRSAAEKNGYEGDDTELMLKGDGCLPEETLSIYVGQGDKQRIFRLVASVVHDGENDAGHYRSIFFEGVDAINCYDGSINGSWLRMSNEYCSKEIARNGYVFIYLSDDVAV